MKLSRYHIRNAYYPAWKDSCGWHEVVVLNSRFLITCNTKGDLLSTKLHYDTWNKKLLHNKLLSVQWHVKNNSTYVKMPLQSKAQFSPSLKGTDMESSEDCIFIRACVTSAFSWRFLCAEDTSRDLLEGYWSGASHPLYTYPINVWRLYRTHNYCCLDLAIPCLYQ